MIRLCEYCRGRSALVDIDCPRCHGMGFYHIDYEAEWHEVQHRAHVQNEAERKRKQKAGE